MLQFLAGPQDQRQGFSGFFLRLVSWLTLVGAPMLVLLLAQLTFLPYHSEPIVWWQRIIVLIDGNLIWYFWNRIRGDNGAIISWVPARYWIGVGAALTICVYLFSIGIATYPGEAVDRLLPEFRFIPTAWPASRWGSDPSWTSLHQLIFGGRPDEVTGQPSGWFSNRLVLTGQSFVDEPDKLDKIEVSHSFRRRDLTRAVFNRADLRKADFTGALLDDAWLRYAKLESAQFGCAPSTSGACSAHTMLQGAHFIQAMLQGADLRQAQLQGADLKGARLQGADLAEAQLTAANLSGAQLQGVVLENAALQGAGLNGAQLQGANLSDAELQGASLGAAKLQGAILSGAQLQGASLAGASLWRARGTPASDPVDFEGYDADTRLKENRQSFLVWREDVLKDIPAGNFRDKANERLSALDPEAKEPNDPTDARHWQTGAPPLPEELRQRELADFLAALACRKDSAPYVARGLLNNDRLTDTPTQTATVAAKLRQGMSDAAGCPGVGGFTETDWRDLDKVEEDARTPFLSGGR
ncbi:MAG: pentapeptide repeat-containing protein [Hyphomicrobiales bacterium]